MKWLCVSVVLSVWVVNVDLSFSIFYISCGVCAYVCSTFANSLNSHFHLVKRSFIVIPPCNLYML